MTLKPSDIFFSYPSILFVMFLLVAGGSFVLWRWRGRLSKPAIAYIVGGVALVCSFLHFYVAPAAKEVSYLYEELQKTNAISHVMGRVLPGANIDHELAMLAQNQVPNNRFDLIPNNHMKILQREFGTSDKPVKMASPSQLEAYLEIVNRCFSGSQKEDLFAKVKVLPVHAGELQNYLNAGYERYLNLNERKPNPDMQCHTQLMSGRAVPAQ